MHLFKREKDIQHCLNHSFRAAQNNTADNLTTKSRRKPKTPANTIASQIKLFEIIPAASCANYCSTKEEKKKKKTNVMNVISHTATAIRLLQTRTTALGNLYCLHM